MFDPFFVGFVFPFIRHQPWQLWGTPKMYLVEQKLCRMWKEQSYLDGSSYLCKLFPQCWGLDKITAELVSKVLYLKQL
jgi:hypothetical protein